MKNKIGVLVIDDSAFIRKALKRIITADEQLAFLGSASNGREGIELVKQLKPDVITLDYNMPDLNGLETLQEIFKTKKIPVIMISSVTKGGSEVTLKALELGAVDFVDKTSAGSPIKFIQLAEELTAKIKVASRAKIKIIEEPNIPKEVKPAKIQENIIKKELYKFSKIIVIGASTGGPQALQHIIPALPYDYPYPIIVGQHIPAFFSKSLAERLNSLSKIKVLETEDRTKIMQRRCYIAKAGVHSIFDDSEDNNYEIFHTQHPTNSIHKPSIDILFKSAAEFFGKKTVGIILTGMGKDGADGLKEIKNSNGTTIAEAESTAVIFGMPKVAIEKNAVNHILTLDKIKEYLINLAKNEHAA